MTPEIMMSLAKTGGIAALAIAAIGSAIGTGTAGIAAIGAWKKCFAQNKAAPFLLLIFIGAPLSQTIYGMILMRGIIRQVTPGEGVDAVLNAQNWPALLIGGLLAGLGMAWSAAFQGKAGAAGSDALAETGQGFANYLMTIGIVETVALFVLVFVQGAL